MRLRSILTLAMAPLALSACQQGGPGQSRADVVPAARVMGEAVSCLQLNAFDHTRVRDNRTIDFIGLGHKAWRNTLPYECPGLRMNDAFSYETSLSQLCSTDIIHVIEHAGGPSRGAACGLGRFVPVELAK
ncbi:MAG: hypothetical protein KGL44_03355 [Sphingomonadales bacterium]|nr:hypothetical protein [Sphingomonadales bacterium]